MESFREETRKNDTEKIQKKEKENNTETLRNAQKRRMKRSEKT